MKLLIVLCLAAIALARPEGETYDTKYDDFDVGSLLENERLLKGYVQCLLEQGSCTPQGKFLKEVIPDALETDCVKCTPKQRVIIKKLVKATKEKFPEELEKIKARYDPEHKHTEQIKKFLEAED